MTENPYKILGVEKSASEKEIKSAYRKLAKQHHPDLNPGDAGNDIKFKSISNAYGILSDPDKRAAYDAGKLDNDGNPAHPSGQRYYRDYASGEQGKPYYHHTTNQFDPEDIESLFGSFFRGGAAGQQAGFKQKSQDAHYTIQIDFMEAALGGKKQVTMPDGKVLNISIPQGVSDRQKLRLKGQGGRSSIGQEAGDAYVEIHINPHHQFSRKGKDIYVDVPISLGESILGKKIPIPTIHGTVDMTLPKGISSGAVLRLKGKGIKEGNQYVTVQITMPKEIDDELSTFFAQWDEKHAYDPRLKEGERT